MYVWVITVFVPSTKFWATLGVYKHGDEALAEEWIRKSKAEHPDHEYEMELMWVWGTVGEWGE